MTENTSLALQGMTTANTMTEHLYIKEAAMLRTRWMDSRAHFCNQCLNLYNTVLIFSHQWQATGEAGVMER